MSATAVLDQPMAKGAVYEASFSYRMPFGLGFSTAFDQLKEHMWDACKANQCTYLLLDADEDARTMRFRWRYDGTPEKLAPIVVGVFIGLAIAVTFILLTVVAVVMIKDGPGAALGLGFLLGAAAVVFVLFKTRGP